jgi:hypothetical protein
MPTKIVYRFHPFFDRIVTVLRTIRQGSHPAVIVRVKPLDNEPDDEDSELRINVPCWMLDQGACANVQLSQQPRIDVEPLLRLRRILDQLAKTSGKGSRKSGPIMAKGDRHESRNSIQTTVAEAAAEATNT